MSDETRRISALKTLVAGSPQLSGTTLHLKIIDEFSEVVRVRGLQPRRRCRLLQILHSTRALDSALAAFLDYHGCRSNTRSLGAYLNKLTHLTTNRSGSITPSPLPQQAKRRYQTNIVDNRNRYMHGSGEYPANDAEITNLLGEMHDCLVTILTL
jgi:hypothetical protein